MTPVLETACLMSRPLKLAAADAEGGRECRLSSISEKNGMRVIGTVERDYVSGRFLAESWEITRDDWNARRVSSR